MKKTISRAVGRTQGSRVVSSNLVGPTTNRPDPISARIFKTLWALTKDGYSEDTLKAKGHRLRYLACMLLNVQLAIDYLMRKDLPQQLLRELLKNAKRSDRELAKILGVSQPTVTRTRHKLEQDGVIQDYTIVPDFKKLGFEIMAINFVKISPESLTSETTERAREFTAKFPNTIFASAGEGLGMNGVSISFYKNYSEYQSRMNESRANWKELFADVRSFIVALGEGEYKRFSLVHLADVPL